ncbi:putative RNA 2'-phosphotransferase [Chitinophaga skermanii]|uniref:Probable RNA 2'-phosphotransferase n=1 Tax=Chitinophaga skermanii TaxID=331697 RepID=A0A327QT29_9BACT|nr:RNA 2'-phosphotransferase [Chitinophaga skermanii]RAJ06573.1 putative RNA 2'-phosphotransferase [Chitinophaga skermanii]
MDKNRTKGTSKFLSYILRHNPGAIGLQLDEAGWADVQELLQKSANENPFTFDDLVEIVDTNDKKRFAFNDDKSKIRASQGHSIEIDLQLVPVTPPEFLYHGTVDKFMASIRAQGLIKGNRQHVHLSVDRQTATNVGSRRGAPVVLSIRSGDMFRDGHAFYLSANGVWLTDAVPSTYID